MSRKQFRGTPSTLKEHLRYCKLQISFRRFPFFRLFVVVCKHKTAELHTEKFSYSRHNLVSRVEFKTLQPNPKLLKTCNVIIVRMLSRSRSSYSRGSSWPCTSNVWGLFLFIWQIKLGHTGSPNAGHCFVWDSFEKIDLWVICKTIDLKWKYLPRLWSFNLIFGYFIVTKGIIFTK